MQKKMLYEYMGNQPIIYTDQLSIESNSKRKAANFKVDIHKGRVVFVFPSITNPKYGYEKATSIGSKCHFGNLFDKNKWPRNKMVIMQSINAIRVMMLTYCGQNLPNTQITTVIPKSE